MPRVCCALTHHTAMRNHSAITHVIWWAAHYGEIDVTCVQCKCTLVTNSVQTNQIRSLYYSLSSGPSTQREVIPQREYHCATPSSTYLVLRMNIRIINTPFNNVLKTTVNNGKIYFKCRYCNVILTYSNIIQDGVNARTKTGMHVFVYSGPIFYHTSQFLNYESHNL